MPAIADKVAALEHDHSDALVKIAALTDALNAMTVEKAALEAKVAELGMHIENVANSALDMLKAVKNDAALVDSMNAAQNVRARDVLLTDEMLKPGPAQQAVAEVLANDSVAWPSAAAQAAESDADQRRLQAIAARMMLPPAASTAEPLSAVDAIKRRSLPFLTLMRRPVDRSMNVAHNVGGLPIFLQRDTVFARSGSQPARM